MSLQPNELLIILLVAVIVLGPKRLPAAIRGMGRVFRQVRDFSASVRQEFDATVNPPTVERAEPAKPSESVEPAKPPEESPEDSPENSSGEPPEGPLDESGADKPAASDGAA